MLIISSIDAKAHKTKTFGEKSHRVGKFNFEDNAELTPIQSVEKSNIKDFESGFAINQSQEPEKLTVNKQLLKKTLSVQKKEELSHNEDLNSSQGQMK